MTPSSKDPPLLHQAIMQVVLSLVVLGLSVAILLAPNFVVGPEVDEEAKKWAYGMIGLLFGYWLGP